MKTGILKTLSLELFDEINNDPHINLKEIDNIFIGWCTCYKLFYDNNNFYLLRSNRDCYDDLDGNLSCSAWIDQWYECNNNELVTGIVVMSKLLK